MSYDAHANFSYSTVATAPSPASTGLSLTVQAGDGAKFPAVPFNATVWPTGVQPLTSNAEIVRVTNIAADTLTITRATESSNARSVIVGDQIAATITKKTFTDIEAGGIGVASQAANDLLYASSATQLARIAGAANSTLVTSGASVPSLSTTLPNAVQDNITRVGTITTDIKTAAYTDYTATSTITGWSAFGADKYIFYKKVGNLVFVQFYLDGTSNATSGSFTLPYTNVNVGKETWFGLGYCVDNGAGANAGIGRIIKNTATVETFKENSGGWTNVNQKIVSGQLWFEAQ